MSALNRAWLYVSRKWGRTVLLLALLAVLAAVSLTALAVDSAAETAKRQVQHELGGYFKVEPDHGLLHPGRVDAKLAQSIMRQPGLTYYNGVSVCYLMTYGLLPVPGRFSAEGDPRAHYSRLIACTSSERQEYFLLNSLELTAGRHILPEDSGCALISDALANKNALGVGDSILGCLDGVILNKPSAMPAEFEFEIVGMFRLTGSAELGAGSAECDMPENFIFTDMDSASRIYAAGGGSGPMPFKAGAMFFATDPNLLEGITSELRARQDINLAGLKISLNNAAYQKMAEPLERLSGAMRAVLWLTLAISAMVLLLVFLLWIKDRRRELGIYLSIGVSRGAIMRQLLLEGLMVAAVSLALAYPLACAASASAQNAALRDVNSHMSAPVEQETHVILAEPKGEARPVELDMRVSCGAMLLTSACGLLLVCGTIFFSSIITLKKKPRELLTHMA